MKLSHASKQRREAKHVAWQRQLLVLACWLALGLAGYAAGPAATPPATPAPAAQEELRAAQLMEAALYARGAKDQEIRKMDGIFDGLEKKYPRDVPIKNARGEYLWSIGQQQQAVEAWLAAEKLDPKYATVLDHLGGAYLSMSEVRKSKSYYQRAVNNAPNDASMHFNYASVLFAFRHDLVDSTHADGEAILVEALQEFSEAARLEPKDAEYARAFAETFYDIRSPDWHAALTAWEHFYEVTALKDYARLNLARVHMKLGQKAEARERLGEVHDPAYDRLKEKLSQRLDSE